jgi:TonB family protein
MMTRFAAVLVMVGAAFLNGCINPYSFKTPAASSEQVYDAADVTQRPYPVRMNRPLYSVRGSADIRCVVRKDGTVAEDRIVRSADPEFGRLAAEMVMKWRFSPAVLNGERVNCIVTVLVNFSIPQDSISTPDGSPEIPIVNNPPAERTH